MTIVADENIPCAMEALGEYGQVRLLSGRAITRAELADADILVVRSITRVDRDLLTGTPVRFVGTATNGIDHIDLDYLEHAGIAFADAAGSNATAVTQYVLAALLELRARGLARLEGERLGIVGVGQIGGRLTRCAGAFGMEVIEHDPPKAGREPAFHSAPFEEIFGCDIVSLHVPLHIGGEHPTRHLANQEFLERLRPGTILINTSRGGVVDSDALLHALHAGRVAAAVLDVWEGEPAVPCGLVEACAIATPHIAAYSFDAKLRGTEMMADAVARFLGAERRWRIEGHLPAVEEPIIIPVGTAPIDAARLAVRHVYDIRHDDAELRELLPLDEDARRAGFDRLRKNYSVRREFPAFTVVSADPAVLSLLAALGFRISAA